MNSRRIENINTILPSLNRVIDYESGYHIDKIIEIDPQQIVNNELGYIKSLEGMDHKIKMQSAKDLKLKFNGTWSLLRNTLRVSGGRVNE